MRRIIVAGLMLALYMPAFCQDAIELDTTTIKGNTELPKFMYVVPWQDRKSEQTQEQKLVLHNLYGDLFDPVLPDYIEHENFQLLNLPAETKP